MTTFVSDRQYLAIKPESTAGDAVIPTVVLPLVSEDMKTVVNHSPDRRINGNDWRGNEMLRGSRQHEGGFTVLCDVEAVAHVLNMLMVKGTSTGDATDGYTHPFSVGDGDSYTIEISKGAFAQRYSGFFVEEVTVDFDDNKAQLTVKGRSMYEIGVRTLGADLSGASTTITLSDEYDSEPTRGLVAGDIVTVSGVDATVVSVSGNVITVTSVSITATAGDTVTLKPQTVATPDFTEPLHFGQLLVGFGDDATSAETAASSRATATPVYDLSINFKNELFAENGSSRFDPVQIIPKTKGASFNLKRLLEGGEQRSKFLDRTKQAVSFQFTGKAINPDFSTQETFKLTFNNVKLTENPVTLEVGELVTEESSFECLYDVTDGEAMSAEVTNRSAGGTY